MDRYSGYRDCGHGPVLYSGDCCDCGHGPVLYSGDCCDCGHGPVFRLWSWTGIQVTLILVMDRYSGYSDCGHGPVFRLLCGRVPVLGCFDCGRGPVLGCFVVVYRY